VLEWATIGGAKALGLADKIGSITPGKQADLVLIRNEQSPALFPLLHPYGSVVFQAQRGDVDTVLVGGQVVKHQHRLLGSELATAKAAVAQTVEYARITMGPEAWAQAIAPDVPETDLIANPYTYTGFDGGEDKHRAQAEADPA